MTQFKYGELDAATIRNLDKYEPWTNKIKLSEYIDRGLCNAKQAGSVANAVLAWPDQPLDGETVTIGADVYEFDPLGTVTPGNIPVLIGVDAAATLTNLVNAINSHGTEFVRAATAYVGVGLWVRIADAVGGTLVGGYRNISLSDTIADAAFVWNQQDLGSVGWQTTRNWMSDYVSINAVNAANDFAFSTTGWNIGNFQAQVYRSGRLILTTATFTAIGSNLVVANGGGSPLLAGDIIRIWACE